MKKTSLAQRRLQGRLMASPRRLKEGSGDGTPRLLPQGGSRKVLGTEYPGFWMKSEQDLVWGTSGYEKRPICAPC